MQISDQKTVQYKWQILGLIHQDEPLLELDASKLKFFLVKDLFLE